MEKNFKEVAVEVNTIFDNMSISILNKIPLKIRDFFKNNASTNYYFIYDKTKSLNEQNIKDETRGIIAILYRDYICNETEKEEYNKIYSQFLTNREEEKRKLYNPNGIFKKVNIANNKKDYNIEETKDLVVVDNEPNLIKKIVMTILRFFKK